MDRYTDAIAALKIDEAQFNSFIRSSFSKAAHILLRSNPRYVTASNNSSSYDLYFVCLELHSCTSSFSVAQSPWPGSLNQLKDELLNQRIKVSIMFDPEGTGAMKIDDRFLVALLNALPDKHFSYPKDKIFAEDTANTIETMTNLDNYKTMLSHDTATSSTPAGPTALVAVTPSTSTSTCIFVINFVSTTVSLVLHMQQEAP